MVPTSGLQCERSPSGTESSLEPGENVQFPPTHADACVEGAQVLADNVRHSHAQSRGKIFLRHFSHQRNIAEQVRDAISQTVRVTGLIKLDSKLLVVAQLEEPPDDVCD